jgi:hypothetical protein
MTSVTNQLTQPVDKPTRFDGDGVLPIVIPSSGFDALVSCGIWEWHWGFLTIIGGKLAIITLYIYNICFSAFYNLVCLYNKIKPYHTLIATIVLLHL